MNQPAQAAKPAIANTLALLAEQLRRWEGTRRGAEDEVISSGYEPLDRLLPERGFRRGTVVEWLGTERGSGAGSLALKVARRAAGETGAIVVLDRARRFYAPGAVSLGLSLAQLIVVRPQNDALHAWALDQVLRSKGVAAVWDWPPEENDHTHRRWQLAAESSGVLGLLMRPATARRAPSWAELRLLVEPVAGEAASPGRMRRLRVELLRSRAGRPGGSVVLEMTAGSAPWATGPAAVDRRREDHEADSLHLAAELAPAKTRRRSRRA